MLWLWRLSKDSVWTVPPVILFSIGTVIPPNQQEQESDTTELLQTSKGHVISISY